MFLDRFVGVLSSIHYPNLTMRFHLKEMYFQVSRDLPCTLTGETKTQKGRKWKISEHMTDSEIVGTIFKAVLTFEEHEVRERFKYQGQPIFNSHYDVNSLAELCRAKAFDIRKEPVT